MTLTSGSGYGFDTGVGLEGCGLNFGFAICGFSLVNMPGYQARHSTE